MIQILFEPLHIISKYHSMPKPAISVPPENMEYKYELPVIMDRIIK
ncbi:MAG: hypothetical protein GY714_18385 [Desulfobacterales bacterium]|nr:hypothetical protein [Desulfobacterales bacterium]